MTIENLAILISWDVRIIDAVIVDVGNADEPSQSFMTQG
jgi:hypothetical protein